MVFDYDTNIAVTQGILAGAARTVGFVSTFPLFTWLELSGILRLTLAFGLALPVIAECVTRELADPTPVGLLFVTVSKEAVLGLGLGLLFGAPIWAMQGMGDVIEMYRGASMEGVYEAVNASETTEAGRFFMILGMGWFVYSGALAIVLEWFMLLYTLWPVNTLTPPPRAFSGWEWGALLDWLQRYAVVLAAPFLVFLFLVDVALGLANASGKQLSVGELSVIGKNAIFLVFLPAYLIFSAVFFGHVLKQFSAVILVMFGVRA